MSASWKYTKDRRWATRRNGAKYLLLGIRENIKHIPTSPYTGKLVLLPAEKAVIEAIVATLDNLLENWQRGNAESKRKYKEGKDA